MKRWSKSEEDELRELYATTTAEALAVHFGTTKGAIQQKCFKLGLKKEQPCTIHLSASQELWLRRNYPIISTDVCALLLGISPSTVTRKARALGLYKSETYLAEAQAHAAAEARKTALRNGSYPPKGYYSPNLQKGKKYQFKRGHKRVKPPF